LAKHKDGVSMLETTLATEFVPGTNLKGRVAGANWSFLLPSLELDRIVCVGAPQAAALTTLSRIGRVVAVVCDNARQFREIAAASQQHGLRNVQPLAAGPGLPSRGEDGADLVLLGGVHARRFMRDRAWSAQIERLLKPDGLVYFELGGARKPSRGDACMGLQDGFGAPRLFWVTPLGGEVQTAVPADDRGTIDYFFRHALYSPSANLRLLKRAEQLLGRHRLFERFVRRHAALVGPAGNDADDRPPRYLRQIARESGVDIDTYRWGLAARGRYNSRKVLFFLFDRAGGAPVYIIKMTRDTAYNSRLENEYRALDLLRGRGIGDRETLPQAAFFGHHAGLAIVGETIVDGLPFRRLTKATADCPYARAALDWLIDLGAATADRTAATPLQVGEGLGTLLCRFEQIYRLSAAHRDFLADQIAAITTSTCAFPLVFQHGDPGTWNIMVNRAGRVAFLDWEAAEPRGMPLWDLFYFMRAYGAWSSRRAGTTDSLKSFGQHFLEGSALNALFIEATARYCDRSGLSKELIEPLFYTCWMHRALKEATRLPAARLERGHYVSLLRLCIDQRGAPALRHLFALNSAG
jgi:hypothetical protein